MKEEMITIETHRRALSLLNYYRKKAEKCVCARPNGRPPGGAKTKTKKKTEIGLRELNREKARVAAALKQVAAIEGECALLVNEVMRWRAAFISKHLDLDVVRCSKLAEAIKLTDKRDKNGARTTKINPIVKARRPRDTDTLAPERQSLLPQVPESDYDRRARPEVSGADQEDPWPDDSED